MWFNFLIVLMTMSLNEHFSWCCQMSTNILSSITEMNLPVGDSMKLLSDFYHIHRNWKTMIFRILCFIIFIISCVSGSFTLLIYLGEK